MERHSITRTGLMVVPHGSQHQDAGDAYRALTAQTPQVAGVGAVDQMPDAIKN
jgi:hypothetical protein